MNAPDYAKAVAEGFVDWLLQDDSPDKPSLALFSLGLTKEGMSVRNTLLTVLRPMIFSQKGGVYFAKTPREILLKVAYKAIERMSHQAQTD